jgi:glucose/arabinose dehydrogenase
MMVAKKRAGTLRLIRAWAALLAAILAATVVVLLAPVSANAAATLPAGFQEEVIFGGLTQPTNVEFSQDGRVFVTEKSGLIKVFDDLSDTTPTTFADLRTNVYNFWDRGLLGLALAPSFPTDPHVYVLYAHDAAIGGTAPRWGTAGATSDPCPTPPGATADGCVVSGRLSKLTASGNTMTGSEQVLIEDWCQQYPSHSIGDLAFGADGALYVSGGDGASFNFSDYGQDGNPLNPCGDPPGGVGATLTPPTAGGGALRSQDLRTSSDPVTLDGAILRVDPATGAARAGNPLAGSADPNAKRIIAYGLRNPFRFTIRPGTSEVWLGDVGWNKWEEINRVSDPTDPVVENFGWPCYERGAPQPGYDSANLQICENLYTAGQTAVTNPYYAYDHAAQVVSGEACGTGSSSVSGLAFYEGGSYPGRYDGALFFADYSRKCIWAMEKGTNGLPDPAKRSTFVAGAAGPVDLEIGPNGDLFYADLYSGTIRRVKYFAANQPPVARATASPTSGPAPLSVSFDGTTSSDPDGDALSYAWDLDGDGAYDDFTTAKPTRTYSTGNYRVGLRVTDSRGATDTLDQPLTISAGNTPPAATISAPLSTTTWKVGDRISFSGSATDQQEGTLPAARLSWSLIVHHCYSDTDCHEHPVQSFPGVASGSFVAPDHEYPAYLELRLTATDSGGLTDTESVRLDPQTVVLRFRTNPTGLKLAVGSSKATTPFSRTVIVGSTNSVSAISPQRLGGKTYRFRYWSDGGAQTHNIVAPASATTYTATYRLRR